MVGERRRKRKGSEGEDRGRRGGGEGGEGEERGRRGGGEGEERVRIDREEEESVSNEGGCVNGRRKTITGEVGGGGG